MNQEDFLNHIEFTFAECLEIAKAKNKDYAGDHDPFNNFNRVQSFNICTVEQGILVRLTDKIARVSNLISSGRDPAVVDESIDDTILDAINYLAILRTYRASKGPFKEAANDTISVQDIIKHGKIALKIARFVAPTVGDDGEYQ